MNKCQQAPIHANVNGVKKCILRTTSASPMHISASGNAIAVIYDAKRPIEAIGLNESFDVAGGRTQSYTNGVRV